MYPAESGSAVPDRPAPPARHRLALVLLAVGISALLIGAGAASSTLGSPLKKAGRTLKLTGVVTEVHKHRVEEEFEIHSTVELLSGSKHVGEFATDDCSALAIHFLICSGKASVHGVGSGLDFQIEWPCVEGEESRCSSVGHGFLSGKSGSSIAALKAKTSFPNFMKLHKRFSVVVHTKG